MTSTLDRAPAPPLDDIDRSADRARGRRRRRRIVGAVVLSGVAAAAVMAWPWRSPSTPAAAPPPIVTATASTKNLTNDATFDGTIAHTAANPILAGASGRITSLAASGTTVDNGQQLFSVDQVPVVMLLGVIPAYRDMTPATPSGPDVIQMQTDMKTLGFDPYDAIRPGSPYDAATAAAVVRWQQQLGVTATGTVMLGSVVFEPAPVTIGLQRVTVGSSVNARTTIADASVPSISMQFTLPADTKTTISIGQTVDVTLPDRSTGKGTITSIGTSVDSTGTTTTVGRGTVEPPRNAAAITDGAAIRVRVSQVVAENVLVVPGAALTNHLDGSFTVTVVRPEGNTTVPVTIGASSNGVVQVTGEGLTAGTKVLMPSG